MSSRPAPTLQDLGNLRTEILARTRPGNSAPVQGKLAAPRQKVANIATAIDTLKGKFFQEELRSMVPSSAKDFSVERLVLQSIKRIQADEKLLAADPQSVVGAVMQCAELGLMPDPLLGHVYLTTTPVTNGSAFGYEAALIPGYRGLVTLSMRSGRIKAITTRLVTDVELDSGMFELMYEGEQDVVRHKPMLLGDSGTPVLAYSIVRFKDGGFHVEVMRDYEILAIKSRAMERWDTHANGTSAWETDEAEMWRKTVGRRALRHVDFGGEPVIARALDLENRLHSGQSQALGRVYQDEAADQTPATPATDPDKTAKTEAPTTLSLVTTATAANKPVPVVAPDQTAPPPEEGGQAAAF